MPLPAPPKDAGYDTEAIENIVPSVKHSKLDTVLSAVGNRGLGVAAQISGQPREDFSETTIGRMLGEHYTQRLNDARRHWENARTYEETLHGGTDPINGEPLTAERRQQLEGMKELAWQDFMKAAGTNKDIKTELEQRKALSDHAHAHGIGVVHGVLSKLGVIGGDKNQASVEPAAASAASTAPATPPPTASVATPPEEATPSAATPTNAPAPPSAVPKNLPTPPGYGRDEQLGAAMEAGHPRTGMGATTVGLAQRKAVADRIGITAENNPVEFQQLMSTGKIPFGASMTLLAENQTGDQVSPDAIKADGTPLSPEERTPDKYYRTQRSPYTGVIIATPHVAPVSGLPSLFTYKDSQGQHVYGLFNRTGPTTGKLTDQKGVPLPAGTEVFDASLAPTTSSTTGPHYTVDQNGNVVVNMGTSVTSRTRGGLASVAPPPQVETPGATAAPTGAEPTGPAAPTAKPPAKVPAQAPAPKASVSSARPLVGPDGEPVHKQLSEVARTGIGNVIIAEDLMDQIMPELNKVVTDIKAKGGDPNSWFNSAQERSAWTQYVQGVDPSSLSEDSILQALPTIDPRLAKLFPKLALLTITGSQPYLRNVRNYNYVRDIRQHLPNITVDSPKNMQTKMFALMDNLPNLERAAYEAEGVKSKPFKPATPDKIQAYADANGLSYADAAHYFRRAGYKISHE